MIPVFKPSHDAREHTAVATCLASGWTGLGPRVAEFEEKFAQYTGASHAIALNSGTAAIHLACRLVGVGPGDEVIVPALTFISTALAPSYLGARPVFADVNPTTLLMDWNHVQRLLTPRTKAIIPVLYGGQPIPDPIPVFSCDGEIPLIFDCAHACGAAWSAAHRICCYSFHSVKNLSCGDGGMLTLPCHKMAYRAKTLRWCGIDTSTYDRAVLGETPTSGHYKWEYNIHEAGYKCHMNDITASIGLVQLSKMPEMQTSRFYIVSRYATKLPQSVQFKAMGGSSWHLLVIRVDRRNDLADYLRTRGINTGVHYKPIHRYPCWNQHSFPYLPVVEREWQRLLTLPLYPDLKLEEVDYICDSIKEFYAHQS